MASFPRVFKSILSRSGPPAALLLLAAFWGGLFWLFHLPSVDSLKDRPPETTRLMELRKEEAASAGRPYRVSRRWVPLSRISVHLQNAVLAGEDDTFYRHKGYNEQALWHSIKENLRRGKFARGGSTITQQLAKNLYLDPRKTLPRKAKELLIARRLEKALEKRRILEIYLNIAEWGNGIFGAEAAARAYFDKSAAELTVDEAVSLAAVLPSPLRHSPVKDSGFAARRKKWILRLMAARGHVPAPAPPPAQAWESVWPPEALPPPERSGGVLVVESGRRSAEYLAAVLEQEGYAVEEASLDTLLPRAAALSPALVILAADWPNRGGLRAVRRLKAHADLAAVPILMTVSGEDEAQDSLRAGADDTVLKPFSREELLLKVEDNAGGWR
jgi:monofunctional glycosyltransferase